MFLDLFKVANAADSASMLPDHLFLFHDPPRKLQSEMTMSYKDRMVSNFIQLEIDVGVSDPRLSQHKFNNCKSLMKAAEECTTTKWRLPGNKFGLMMRTTNDQYIQMPMSSQQPKSP